MKKIDRLKWIEENFGPEFVLKHFYCTTWIEIKEAVKYFHRQNKTYGMRTDSKYGAQQKDRAPFILHGTQSQVFEIWQKYGTTLYYIVSKNQPPKIKLQGVAQLVYKEDQTIWFEYNEIDQFISQRQMYDKPSHLKELYISLYRHSSRSIGLEERIVNCFFSHENFVIDKSFHVIYKLFFNTVNVDEITFTVLLNGEIIIW